MFKDTVALPGYPRPLGDWGMTTTRGQPPQRVDAAFVWTHNHKTYLFSEGHFWRFDESGPDRRLEAGYPRAASLWTGVPSDPDDVISWKDGELTGSHEMNVTCTYHVDQWFCNVLFLSRTPRIDM